jgi:hypothetical protein
MIPRGGGAFLAEVDGNIALLKKDATLLATAQGKFRGSDAWSLRFELEVIRDHPLLKDVRGRQISTVVAKPISENVASAREMANEQDKDRLLRMVPGPTEPRATATDIARKLRWFIKGDPNQPYHAKVTRGLVGCKRAKLVEELDGRWRLTEKGQRELNERETMGAGKILPMPPLPPFNR